MNRKAQSVRVLILHLLCEGMSQRSCSRVCDVALETVQKLFADAGDAAIAYVKSEISGLTPRSIQADELHSFVGRKGTASDEEDEDEDEDLVSLHLSRLLLVAILRPGHREEGPELSRP